MDTQPKIPTLKDSQKPQVKVRGLEAGMSLMDRLKTFKKKDMAFILAGLGTLFMAPLAEHFMMSPEGGDGTLQQGWKGGSGGKGMFDGSGSSPYEPGTTGMAPGGAVGGGSDVITPLNVRDPSALVMGPGATQQPPTSSAMPSTPPPTAPSSHSDSDLKDALAASARGVGAAANAAKRTALPVPKMALGGSGLRGLGVAGGGSSAASGPISSNGLVSGKAANGSNFGGVNTPSGYKGVARGQTGGGGGALDALRAAADKAAGAFNRGGAADSLNAAANTAIPSGNGGALGGNGAGGIGSTDKAFSGNNDKSSKNVGESLAFLKQKQIQEAQIELWKEEQKAGDNKLELLKIRNSAAEAMATKFAGAVADNLACAVTSGKGGLKGCWGAGAKAYLCVSMDGTRAVSVSASDVTDDGHDCDDGKDTKGKLYINRGGGSLIPCNPSSNRAEPLQHCNQDDPKKPEGDVDGDGVNGLARLSLDANVTGLNGVCAAADKDTTALGATITPGAKIFYEGLKTTAQSLIAARDAMFKGASGDCKATPLSTQFPGQMYASAVEAATKARDTLAGKIDADNSVVSQLKPLVGLDDEAKVPGAAAETLKLAEIHRSNANAILASAFANITQATPPAPPAEFGPAAKAEAQKYTNQLISAKTTLSSYKGQLDAILADKQGSIQKYQMLLDKMATSAPEGSKNQTLKDVVLTNKAYADAEKDFQKAGGEGAVTDGKPATPIKPADAAKDATAPSADFSGTQAAIATAQASIGVTQGRPTNAINSVKFYIEAKEKKMSEADVTKALNQATGDLSNGSRDMAQMQKTQTGALDGVATAIRAIALPQPPTK